MGHEMKDQLQVLQVSQESRKKYSNFFQFTPISSTEVISLHDSTKSDLVGHLNEKRQKHGMAIAKVNGKATLLAFGGYHSVSGNLDSIEQWLDSIEQWIPESQSWEILSNRKLSEAKRYFGYLSVPTKLVCPCL